jgi:flagellar basal-body rod modification protein FlgD
MPDISQVLNKNIMADTDAPVAKNKNAMGKDDFLKLLMAQLQNQDPMKPMDHQEFSAQLAQFSSLEQLTNINKSIETLHTDQGEGAKLQALSVIGKKVQALGNEIQLTEGSPVSLHHGLPPDYKPDKAVIYDMQGQLVREITFTGKEQGTELVWDGKNDAGGKLPSGKYTFRVSGVGPNGQTQDAGAQLEGTVTAVEMNGKKATLIVETPTGKTKIDMDKVQKVISDTREPVVPKAAPAATKPATAPKVIEMPKEAIEPDDDAESEIVMEEPRGRNPVMDDPLLTWVRR